MAIDFELTLDSKDNPCIKFKHHNKSTALDQKLLDVFIRYAKDKGLSLKSPSGYLNSSGESWTQYKIRIKED